MSHATARISDACLRRRLKFDRLKAVLESKLVVSFFIFLIFSNAMMIAFAADMSIRDALAAWWTRTEGRPEAIVTPEWFFTVDLAFNTVFLIEIFLRILAFEVRYNSGFSINSFRNTCKKSGEGVGRKAPHRVSPPAFFMCLVCLPSLPVAFACLYVEVHVCVQCLFFVGETRFMSWVLRHTERHATSIIERVRVPWCVCHCLIGVVRDIPSCSLDCFRRDLNACSLPLTGPLTSFDVY